MVRTNRSQEEETPVGKGVGDLVRAYRRRAGMSQEELAEDARISVRTIREIESGRISAPRPATRRLLAEAFALSGRDRAHFLIAAAGCEPLRPSTDVSTDPERPALPDRPNVPNTLAQLPAALAGFAGRARQLEFLTETLHNGVSSDALAIATVSGPAGVGKTALAVEWAHRVAGLLPDGQLYVDLRGFDPSGAVINPFDVIRTFLDAFGVDPARVPADPAGLAAFYRSVMSGRRMLVVLDNARDAAQVRPLLPGAGTCMVVVTSRNQLTGLVAVEGAHPIVLDVLSRDEGRQLLRARLGGTRTERESGAVDELIEWCAGLPLALTAVAARAAIHSAFPLAALVSELRHSDTRLDPLGTTDCVADVRAAFSWSYRQLSPSGQRLFRLIGLHPGPSLSVPAMASLAGVSLDDARPLITELADSHHVTEFRPGRFTQHDLLRAYAGELCGQVESDTDRDTAIRRLLDHYAHMCQAADRLVNPFPDPLVLTAPEAGSALVRPESRRQAIDTVEAEFMVLLNIIDHTVRTGLTTYTWQLASAMHFFLQRRGRRHEITAVHTAVLAALEQVKPAPDDPRIHQHLGRAYSHLERPGEAHRHLRRALEIHTGHGDAVAQAHVHASIGFVHGQERQHESALRQYAISLGLSRRTGHTHGEARAWNGVAWHRANLGAYEQAHGDAQRAVELFEVIDDPDGRAEALGTLGLALRHLGRYGDAVDRYEQAIGLFRADGNLTSVAGSLMYLGDTYEAAGRRSRAREVWREADAILDELGRAEEDMFRSRPGRPPASGASDDSRGVGHVADVMLPRPTHQVLHARVRPVGEPAVAGHCDRP
ncbi:tetratricopeptide repeat protein [Streptomyces sp. NBC_00481]|uniref:ATP-binding protein n=1 Tax=Streptomyces sp. NBC_00481 TaxID=2975755 RepID=UPI002DDA98D1|nr:tetratricopeptide repeat protein [Streptomyces sp. NBC_00481]WRZ01501.1 tetratricopeptide repeat protein [Streptomyces sp. NBC_00481]